MIFGRERHTQPAPDLSPSTQLVADLLKDLYQGKEQWRKSQVVQGAKTLTGLLAPHYFKERRKKFDPENRVTTISEADLASAITSVVGSYYDSWQVFSSFKRDPSLKSLLLGLEFPIHSAQELDEVIQRALDTAKKEEIRARLYQIGGVTLETRRLIAGRPEPLTDTEFESLLTDFRDKVPRVNRRFGIEDVCHFLRILLRETPKESTLRNEILNEDSPGGTPSVRADYLDVLLAVVVLGQDNKILLRDHPSLTDLRIELAFYLGGEAELLKTRKKKDPPVINRETIRTFFNQIRSKTKKS